MFGNISYKFSSDWNIIVKYELNLWLIRKILKKSIILMSIFLMYYCIYLIKYSIILHDMNKFYLNYFQVLVWTRVIFIFQHLLILKIQMELKCWFIFYNWYFYDQHYISRFSEFKEQIMDISGLGKRIIQRYCMMESANEFVEIENLDIIRWI